MTATPKGSSPQIPVSDYDLLYRANSGALNIDVPAVISNHPDLGILADTYSVPFRHIPVTPQTKAEAEAQLLIAIDELNIDLVVLARYMQILSGDLCGISRAEPSTFTTRCCPASRAHGRTSRPTIAV